MEIDTAIVGGGLAGLSLARRLHDAGRDFQLFEARGQLGGRIKTFRIGEAGFDLGPSWFWPGQPLFLALVRELGLEVFDQYAAGEACFEDETGRVHRGAGFASMAGAWRLTGGMSGIIDGLAAGLPAGRVHVNAAVRSIHRDGTIVMADGESHHARRIVLAIPPRVALNLEFTPALDPSERRALENIPTWMAGHAKFVATYERPFWRDAGLSGDGVSRCGPLAEIHDASAAGGTPAALFGFVGVPAVHRAGHAEAIESAALQQLARLFGDQALHPLQTAYQDWSTETETASELDHAMLTGHPTYGLPAVLQNVWGGVLHFGTTEMVSESGGLMEGALLRADALARLGD